MTNHADRRLANFQTNILGQGIFIDNKALYAEGVADLIAYAKTNLGRVDVASDGLGSVSYLAGIKAQ